jgi:hypothetical protein
MTVGVLLSFFGCLGLLLMCAHARPAHDLSNDAS